MKILLPVDGSECALRAVEYLISHSAWFRDLPEIHLLHVHAPIPIGRVQAHVGKETLHAYYLEESQASLLEAQQKLDAEQGCDLIVMGTHGRGGIAGLVTGSVANRVLHLASCPVLLVK